MKKTFFVFLLALCACIANAGTLVTDSIQSKILGEEQKFNVYLPDGFDRTNKLYPVVYLLHGLTDTYEAWDKKGLMKPLSDELIRSGEAVEMVVVMPNAGGPDRVEYKNGYFNMSIKAYEDFFFQEFMPEVEKRYRVVSDKGHRAVMGLSMGGGASVVYCQKHPDMFSSCFAMSPWLDEFGKGVKYDPAVRNNLTVLCEAVHENSCLDFLRNASPEVIESLRGVKWFVDCGDDDFLLPLSLEFYSLMKEKKIKCELRVRDGVHNWEYWHASLRMGLPFASRNFWP